MQLPPSAWNGVPRQSPSQPSESPQSLRTGWLKINREQSRRLRSFSAAVHVVTNFSSTRSMRGSPACCHSTPRGTFYAVSNHSERLCLLPSSQGLRTLHKQPAQAWQTAAAETASTRMGFLTSWHQTGKPWTLPALGQRSWNKQVHRSSRGQ